MTEELRTTAKKPKLKARKDRKSEEKWQTGSVLPESFITLSLFTLSVSNGSKGMEENPTGLGQKLQRRVNVAKAAQIYESGSLTPRFFAA